MPSVFAALAPLPVGVILIWAGGFKLVSAAAPEAARRSALRKLVGEQRVVPVYRAVGVGELLLGAVLVLPPSSAAEAGVATAASAGLLGYLTYARIAAPQSSCGCLSEKQAPVRWRAFARAALLLVTSAAALGAPGYWLGAVLDRPLAAGSVLVAWVAVVMALSEELDRHWLIPLRRLRVRLSHPLAGPVAGGVPLVSTMDKLYRSEAYRSVVLALRSDVLESWDEDGWRIVTFAARRDRERSTAVFAVPLRGDGDIRVALVPEPEPVTA